MDTPDIWHCRYLNRQVKFCRENSIIVVDYAGGVGACAKHVAQVVLWCMDKNERGGLPEKPVTVYPAWQYDEYRRHGMLGGQ